MKIFLIFFLILLSISAKCFADVDRSVQKDGFYVGVDQTKADPNVGKIDNSVAQNPTTDSKYYGYKVSEGGFFISPEVAAQQAVQAIDPTKLTNNASNAGKANSANATRSALNYDLRANLGYEFNSHVSGFLTYDVAQFSYDSTQGAISVDTSKAVNSSVFGVGSQIKVSNDFGIRVSYIQQGFDNSATSGGRIKSDVIKVGTVLSF